MMSTFFFFRCECSYIRRFFFCCSSAARGPSSFGDCSMDIKLMLLSLLSAVLASDICSLLLAVSVVYGLSAVCCLLCLRACVLAVWACELAVCPGISNTSISIFFRGPSGPTLLAASNITGQNITYSTLLLTSNVHP